MRNLRTNPNPLFVKAIGVLLAFSLVGAVLGLHRLWMHKKYWWLHPLFFVAAVIASNIFLKNPENISLAKQAYENYNTPHIHEYSNVWLLSFGLLWIGLVVFDCIKVFSWPAPYSNKSKGSGNV